MGNPYHGPDGKFSSGGAASGDHQASATPPQTPRMAVRAHAGVPSVGTSTRGFSVRVRPKGPRLDTGPARDPQQTTTGLRRAARERVALNERVDRGHYPDTPAEIKNQFTRRVRGY